MKWIKATKENFPTEFGITHFRESKNKYPISQATAYSWARKGLYDMFEWLDESINQDKIKELEGEVERLEKIIDAIPIIK